MQLISTNVVPDGVQKRNTIGCLLCICKTGLMTCYVIGGYVFLRDVYENLGTPITRDSCIAGWKRDNESDDVFVKITIQEVGYSSNLALDFNVEENILDKFE